MDAMTRWNGLPDAAAERELLACCAVPAWARTVLAGRPYPDPAALTAVALRVLDGLAWADILTALAAHPRIGERIAASGRAADWSRREQSGAANADAQTAAALVEANRSYEERFGHVFLIFATGRTATDMLATAQARLRNDPITERDIVRAELSKITKLRLERMVVD